MSSEVEICNRALSKLGNGERAITLLTDDTVEGRTLNRLYANTRDLVLAEYPYRHSPKTIELKKKPGKINDMVYFDDYDMFIAVGDDGIILTSIGGVEDWIVRKSGVSTHLNAICIFGTTLVVVGNAGVILTSSDGTTWTARTSGTTKNIYGVGNNSSTSVVAVGATGLILSSTAVATWTPRTSGVLVNLRDIVYGNSLYCAVGDAGKIITSTDMVTWTAQTSSISNKIYSITYGTIFVAVGQDGVILTSSAAVTWVSAIWGSDDLRKSRYLIDTYFITGDGCILVSTDAATWSDQVEVDSAEDYRSIAYSTNDERWASLGDEIGYYTETLTQFTGAESYVSLDTLDMIGTVISTSNETEWTEIDFMVGYGYDHVYMAPTDILNIRGVNTDGSETQNDTVGYARIEEYIVSDEDDLYLIYVRKITDTTKFSEHLCDTIAIRLAYLAAPDIKGSTNRDGLLKDYVTAIFAARGVDSRQQSVKGADDSTEWTQVGR